MKLTSAHADKLAIGFSSLCVIHCFATPLLFLLLPTTVLASLNPEAFHFLMVILVVPTSVYAFTLGYKKHRQLAITLYAVVGLATLISSVILGEHYLGELGEKLVTVIGAGILAFAHYKNFTLCKDSHYHQQSTPNKT